MSLSSLLLLSTALLLSALSSGFAADHDHDGLADDAETLSTTTVPTTAPIAIVDTGNSAVGILLSRLTSLGYAVTTIPMNSGLSTLILHQLVILPVGHGQLGNYATFDSLSSDYNLYVNSGGRLWVGQPNPYQMPGGQATITWVPYALTVDYLYDLADCPPVVFDDTHCITQNAGNTNFSFPADTVVQMGPQWQVLVVGSVTGNPSVMVATSGMGKVLVEFGHPSPSANCPHDDFALDRYVTCLLTPPVPIEQVSWGEIKGRYQ